MGIVNKNGFTVIETMLFLSITGLMVVTMIVGTNATVNNQRYIDSVRTFKSLVQEQYARLASTENNRVDDDICLSIGGNEESRGRSQCEIVGRYMVIQNDDIKLYSIIMHGSNNTSLHNGDIAFLSGQSVNYAHDLSLVESTKMEWGASPRAPSAPEDIQAPSGNKEIGLLFIRSPRSGYVYTFSSQQIPKGDDAPVRYIKQMISDETAQRGVAMCIDSDGLLTRDNMYVYIQPYASSASAVESGTSDHPVIEGLEC